MPIFDGLLLQRRALSSEVDGLRVGGGGCDIDIDSLNVFNQDLTTRQGAQEPAAVYKA